MMMRSSFHGFVSHVPSHIKGGNKNSFSLDFCSYASLIMYTVHKKLQSSGGCE